MCKTGILKTNYMAKLESVSDFVVVGPQLILCTA